MDTRNSPSPAMHKPGWNKIALGAFSSEEQMAFIQRVWGFMAGGLAISALVALGVASNPTLAHFVLGNSLVFYGLLIAEIALVLILSLRLHRMSGGAAAAAFLAYSALNGITLSVIFFAFTLGSVAGIFLTTAGMFAALAAFGYFTRIDLTGLGAFAGMALFGLILAMLINLFFANQSMNLVLAGLGVLIFTVLTAYDTQKLKWLFEQSRAQGDEAQKRLAVQGALALYLDFVNLFLQLLQLFGRRQ